MIITELQEKKRITLDYVPSHKTDGKYAILMETSSEEYESWYYFIRVEGNEENLNHLILSSNDLKRHNRAKLIECKI